MTTPLINLFWNSKLLSNPYRPSLIHLVMVTSCTLSFPYFSSPVQLHDSLIKNAIKVFIMIEIIRYASLFRSKEARFPGNHIMERIFYANIDIEL
ncbi:MAG TPA: hypothetical protein EYH04_03640 [Archaeoglobus profundus]|nr:hypothetical protein [Archaeoglobus profundus]